VHGPQEKRRKRFSVVIIKPSHYDDDGYVIQWHRSPVTANSLAVVYALALDCANRRVLGDDVAIELHPFDETNTRIRAKDMAALVEDADAGMVMLVGVQSNQFPRALDIARPLRDRGIMVAIGGFHVSGTLAMLKERDPDVRRAEQMGISLFAGEAEGGRLDAVLQDAARGELKPLYNFMDDLPELEGAITPLLPADRIRRVLGGHTSFDAGRGCPFTCSFCTIINVQGRKSRWRTADDVEHIVRTNLAQGVHSFFITDDNFARNKNWEAIFDRLIYLREVEGFGDIKCSIQVDTGCHRIPNFIDKARRAGAKRVFIGLENINPENLKGARKNQNKITEYRQMLLDWKKTGAIVFCGYILGFPNDTPESILRDVRIIQEELPTDLLEFTCLTPLPGSEDHRNMVNAGLPMDDDLNRFDVNHVTIPHERMSRDEWEAAYMQAWEDYYSDKHIETVLKRCVATGTSPGKTLFYLVWFKGSHAIEGAHPAEGGGFRLKFRRDRRPSLGIEPVWVFYPKYWFETVWKLYKWGSLYTRCYGIMKKAIRETQTSAYSDLAITPVTAEEVETRELFQTPEARNFVVQIQRVEKMRSGAAA